MDHFFIDLEINGQVVKDDEGVEFRNQAAAETEARAALLEQAKRCLSFEAASEITVTVRDVNAMVFKATAQTTCCLV